MSDVPAPSRPEVFVNELAQGLRPMHEGFAWFGSLDEQRKRAVLREVAAYIAQAGGQPDDLVAALQVSGIKATSTAAVLLSKPALPIQLAKVANLPEPELERAFPLVVALLGVADHRRRQAGCGSGCNHWWHQLAGG